MFAPVTKMTDRSSIASTRSCSTFGNRPRTIGSTFARVSETVSDSGSGCWLSPAVNRLISRTRALRRSSWARSSRCRKPPDQAER
jgi:hypothetical protein